MKNVKKIDIIKHPDLAKKYNVQATPTLIIETKTKEGVVLGRCEGTTGSASKDMKECSVSISKKVTKRTHKKTKVG